MAKLSRFEVVAALQAARGRALGLKLDEAKSWGLYRAELEERIRADGPSALRRSLHDASCRVGSERASIAAARSSRIRFKLGDHVLTPEEFDRRVRARFPDWERAWAEAQRLVRAAAHSELAQPDRFARAILDPMAEELRERWSRRAPAGAGKSWGGAGANRA